ncbi:uncharacterized protein LOC120706397 isoform X2 [Panicum virgatum]|uniref:uncharacterized protein LOC120706397 isoform X2 n=1 Tax=Panicum virgatum TaxID=38727 RepID=UPI0019D54826|nr:uncharacterized protein LOC120706397 isoform X2 [Panicum virgatum]
MNPVVDLCGDRAATGPAPPRGLDLSTSKIGVVLLVPLTDCLKVFYEVRKRVSGVMKVTYLPLNHLYQLKVKKIKQDQCRVVSISDTCLVAYKKYDTLKGHEKETPAPAEDGAADKGIKEGAPSDEQIKECKVKRKWSCFSHGSTVGPLRTTIV